MMAVANYPENAEPRPQRGQAFQLVGAQQRPGLTQHAGLDPIGQRRSGLHRLA